jgi:hypothetical protein
MQPAALPDFVLALVGVYIIFLIMSLTVNDKTQENSICLNCADGYNTTGPYDIYCRFIENQKIVYLRMCILNTSAILSLPVVYIIGTLFLIIATNNLIYNTCYV